MFEKYSKSGENLSGKQMQYEFELSATPFDKITLSQFGSPEEMEAAAKEKAERLTEGKMRRVYDDAEKRFKETKIKQFAKTNMGYDILMDKLEKVIKTYQPREFTSSKFNIPTIDNNETKSVIF
jgi:predicted DNA-binding WGR domain protein